MPFDVYQNMSESEMVIKKCKVKWLSENANTSSSVCDVTDFIENPVAAPDFLRGH